METLKVYQIGLGSFGRHGFEKLVEMQQHLERVDLELVGVCDRDFDRLEKAVKYAEANGIEVETFAKPAAMYERAESHDSKVMVYDAGPANYHSDHISESLQRGFYHLAEKPPSMTREEHLQQRKLSQKTDVFYKADFIERENPVVRKAIELLQDERIDSIDVFRESSVGAQKVLQPVKREGVTGGDILDKMDHEIYVLDLLDAAGINRELDLVKSDSRYLMPKAIGSEKLMSIDGGPTREIGGRTATGMTRAVFDASGTTVRLHSSWLGSSQEAEAIAEDFRNDIGRNPISSGYTEAGEAAFRDEEARFFVIRGSKNLVGDMLHGELYDLESGNRISTPEMIHDQLYRVIEKAVISATGKEVEPEITEDEIDVFMNAIFDARQQALEASGDFMEELDAANTRLKNLVFPDIDVESETGELEA